MIFVERFAIIQADNKVESLLIWNSKSLLSPGEERDRQAAWE